MRPRLQGAGVAKVTSRTTTKESDGQARVNSRSANRIGAVGPQEDALDYWQALGAAYWQRYTPVAVDAPDAPAEPQFQLLLPPLPPAPP